MQAEPKVEDAGCKSSDGNTTPQIADVASAVEKSSIQLQKAVDEAPEALSAKQNLAAWLMVGFYFCLANVGDGLGPIQAVYLVSTRDWSAGTAGFVWMLREVSTMCASSFVGNVFDHVHNKQRLLVVFMTVLTAVNMVIMFTDNLIILTARAVVAGIMGSAIKNGYSCLTLGIVGPKFFDEWAAKGEASNHLGSCLALLIAGIVAFLYFPDVYLLFAVFGLFGVAGTVCVICIPWGTVDFNRARNSQVSNGSELPPAQPVTTRELLMDKNLVLWHVIIFMFHLSNAAVLPLLGQVVADPNGTAGEFDLSGSPERRLGSSSSDKEGMLWACSLIVICNAVSTVSALATHQVVAYVQWKFLLLAGFALQVPRTAGIGLIMRFLDSNRILLSATQIFDGIMAAVNGMCCMVVTKALTEGSGRFGAVSGSINMVWAAGTGLGNVALGFVADVNYELAFYICGVLGLCAVLLITPLQVKSRYLTDTSDKCCSV